MSIQAGKKVIRGQKEGPGTSRWIILGQQHGASIWTDFRYDSKRLYNRLHTHHGSERLFQNALPNERAGTR